jgi:hypothetical protein
MSLWERPEVVERDPVMTVWKRTAGPMAFLDPSEDGGQGDLTVVPRVTCLQSLLHLRALPQLPHPRVSALYNIITYSKLL